MFGDTILAAPVTSPADNHTGRASKSVWLPASASWVDFASGAPAVSGRRQWGVDEIPLFVERGAAAPLSQWGCHAVPLGARCRDAWFRAVGFLLYTVVGRHRLCPQQTLQRCGCCSCLPSMQGRRLPRTRPLSTRWCGWRGRLAEVTPRPTPRCMRIRAMASSTCPTVLLRGPADHLRTRRLRPRSAPPAIHA